MSVNVTTRDDLDDVIPGLIQQFPVRHHSRPLTSRVIEVDSDLPRPASRRFSKHRSSDQGFRAGKQGRLVDGSLVVSEILGRDFDRTEVRVRKAKVICVGMPMTVLGAKMIRED